MSQETAMEIIQLCNEWYDLLFWVALAVNLAAAVALGILAGLDMRK